MVKTIEMDCRHIQLCDRPEQIDLQQLQHLFQMAAFWANDRRVDDLAIAIRHSNPVISAWDGDRLIGFARAISDGIYRATIWDVVIHPDYQGAGLGRKLVETVLSHPHINRVERVYLMTTDRQSFYQKIGFEVNSSTTMVLFNQPIAALNVGRSVEADLNESPSSRTFLPQEKEARFKVPPLGERDSG